MDYTEQRELGAKLFPELKEFILDLNNCYYEIASKIIDSGLVDKFLALEKLLSEWAYYWARHIGDKDLMRDRITESEWAYKWAFNIGDRELMRDRITESEWAYYWALHIGDRELMRDRITESEWLDKWGKLDDLS